MTFVNVFAIHKYGIIIINIFIKNIIIPCYYHSISRQKKKLSDNKLKYKYSKVTKVSQIYELSTTSPSSTIKDRNRFTVIFLLYCNVLKIE